MEEEEEEIPEIIDDYKKYYEKKDLIGRGQFGKVYKGMDKKSKEMRALKVMDIYGEEEIFMKQINNELKNMKICSNDNDNSVKIYECFHYENKFILIMELCNTSLQKILDEKKEGFTCEEIFNIMSQLNNTFKIMNENKIIHRDIKLDNIVVKYNDENKDSNYIVKLTDYGVSKQLMNSMGKTFVGTYFTMAPEILGGERGKNYDNKCDLWSIGIIMYQLFFKEYPYKGETPVAIYNQIKNCGNKSLKSTQNSKLDNLIKSLLINEPSKRINYDQYFNHPFFKEKLNYHKFNNNNCIISKIELKDINENEINDIKFDSLKDFYIENNRNNNNQVSFYMHIKIIGSNIQKFYDEFKKSIKLRNIIKHWVIDKLDNSNVNDQINKYFDHLNEVINQNKYFTEDLREVLILKIKNICDQEFNIFLTKMNDISKTQYIPLVLLLTENKSGEKLNIDTEKYENIDPRLIFLANYTDNPDKMEKEIYPLLLRFCSIHNELGDNFSVKNGNNIVNYDLIGNKFHTHINIVCLGRVGQGKSTGVNALLQEYKSKEGNKGSPQTKKIIVYHVKNLPIRILDIPGHNTVKETLEMFEELRNMFYMERNNTFIFLYFINYSVINEFSKLEYPIIKNITFFENSKIIYVITNSESNLSEEKKNGIFDRINIGIEEIIKNTPISGEIKMFEADDNNVAFVNFQRNELNDEKPFGKRELFKKIHDFLIQFDYINSLRDINIEKIKETAFQLRELTKEVLLTNKIWSKLAGIIPFVDYALQKNIIEKNAIKKIGKIYGINIKEFEGDKPLERKSSFLEILGNEFLGKVGFGGYFSNEFCEKLIDKCENYYIFNQEKLINSFKNAVEYFLLQNEK